MVAGSLHAKFDPVIHGIQSELALLLTEGKPAADYARAHGEIAVLITPDITKTDALLVGTDWAFTGGVICIDGALLTRGAVPAAQAIIAALTAAIPKEMIVVPAGTFMRKGTTDVYEQPAHQVTISKAFFMGKYEVTQAEWNAVMGTNLSCWKGDTLPMETVSWYDAVEYCNKRSMAEGLTPCYSGADFSVCDFSANGYRLPTEAEWEWAARGGGKGRLYYEYSGSDNVDEVAWYDGNSRGKTYSVGHKLPNSLGLYDMSGNVWEWCWDWFGSYSGDNQTDPTGPASGAYRVPRGGSWGDLAEYVRSASRGHGIPDVRYYNIGFRLVRSL